MKLSEIRRYQETIRRYDVLKAEADQLAKAVLTKAAVDAALAQALANMKAAGIEVDE